MFLRLKTGFFFLSLEVDFYSCIVENADGCFVVVVEVVLIMQI